jgi:hypothetical protein
MLTAPQLHAARCKDDLEPADLLTAIASFAHSGPELFGRRPWRLVVVDNSIEVHTDLDTRLKQIDADSREAIIATGAAIYFIRLAMRCHELAPKVLYRPDHSSQTLLARITAEGPATPSAEDIELFSVLTGPSTASSTTSPLHAISPDLQWLAFGACEEGVKLRCIENESLRSMTASMLQPGDKLFFNTAEECDDLRIWLGLDRLSQPPSGGLVAWSLSASEVGQFREVGMEDASTAVLCSNHENVGDWINSGQALGRVCLIGAALGMNVAVFNQPLQVPGMRARFARETGFCSFPQVILRVSYTTEWSADRQVLQRMFLRSTSGISAPCGCGCGGE